MEYYTTEQAYDEEGIEYTVDVPLSKYLYSLRSSDGGTYALWGAPEADCQMLWHITNHDGFYDVVNCATGTRFDNVSRSTPVTMSADNGNLMAISFVGTGAYGQSFIHLRVSTQEPDSYRYLHQGNHGSGRGTGGSVVGWYNSYDGSDPGPSEWELMAVSDEEAQQIIAYYEQNIKYQELYAELRSEAEARLEQAKGNRYQPNYDSPLITDVTQLSSPWTDPTEGSIEALIDGDTNTFWHSNWHSGSVENHTHYLQVDVGSELYTDVLMQFTRRDVVNDHITQWSVYGSNDPEAEDDAWTPLASLSTPFGSSDETCVAGPFNPSGMRYLRFYIDGTTSGRGYGHLSELQLYPAVPKPLLKRYLLMGAAARQLEAVLEAQSGLQGEDINQQVYEELQAAYDAYLAREAVVETWDELVLSRTVDAKSLQVGHCYFLMNVGAGQYLAAGNRWATQASLTQDGITDLLHNAMVVRLGHETVDMDGTMVEGSTLQLCGRFSAVGTENRPFFTEENTYVFRDSRFEGYENFGFVDRASQPSYLFKITRTDEGYFRIQTAPDDPNCPNAANEYVGWDASGGYDLTTNSELLFNLSADNSNHYIDWIFVEATEAGNVRWELERAQWLRNTAMFDQLALIYDVEDKIHLAELGGWSDLASELRDWKIELQAQFVNGTPSANNDELMQRVRAHVLPNLRPGAEISVLIDNPDAASKRQLERPLGWNLMEGNITESRPLTQNTEAYHQPFHLTQTLPGMPKGVYQLYLKGFVRHDGAADGEQPVFYCGTASAPLMNIYDAGSQESFYSEATHNSLGDYMLDKMNEDGLYYPNGMTGAHYFFQHEYYQQGLEALHTEDGDLNIGIRGTADSDWVVWSHWRLTYAGVPHQLAVQAAGHGQIIYEGQTVRAEVRTFEVIEHTTIELSVIPDQGYRVAAIVLSDGTDLTDRLSDGRVSIEIGEADMQMTVTFEKIYHTLSLIAHGPGTIAYGDQQSREEQPVGMSVDELTQISLTITPDEGAVVEQILLDGEDVTADLRGDILILSPLKRDATLEVTFGVKLFDLDITVVGAGSVTYGSTEVTRSQKFQVNSSEDIVLGLKAFEGNKLGKVSVRNGEDSREVTDEVSDGLLTLGHLTDDAFVVAEFVSETEVLDSVAIAVTIEGLGTIKINGKEVEEDGSVNVAKGSNVVFEFFPEAGFRLGTFKLNGLNMTGQVQNGIFIQNGLEDEIAVHVLFVDNVDNFVLNDISYGVTDIGQGTVKVLRNNYRNHVVIPETVVYRERTWTVTGIDRRAFYDCPDLLAITVPATVTEVKQRAIDECPQLAAIVWNADIPLTQDMLGSYVNPNMLFYVKQASLAPATARNVVVNGQAQRIELMDARANNSFYCPQTFTAEEVSYTHEYIQTTKHGTCQGWESLVLPFDVQTITHETKQEIYPFALLSEQDIDDGKKPFWLYEFTTAGYFVSAEGIKANVPYIISMPNDSYYLPEYALAGRVTFAATGSVEVRATTEAVDVEAADKAFCPNYQHETLDLSPKYLLNVSQPFGTIVEGSVFARYRRAAQPFEAYFRLADGAPVKEYIGVFEELPNGIESLSPDLASKGEGSGYIYDLSGRQIVNSRSVNRKLRAGVYIIDGKKVVVK